MNTKPEEIHIANLSISVVRKKIKRMHLAVYPPDGVIRVSAPIETDFEVIRLFVISKLTWIKKNVNDFKNQARETERTYVSGESHYFKGKRYLLQVIPTEGRTKIELSGSKKMKLHTKPVSNQMHKASALKEWYRTQLKSELPELIQKWEKTIGVKSNSWGVKQMKTKWGTCNIEAGRIWLNLELAKKPKICLEYIIVHELVHLLERHHNERFVAYMDQFMPKWRLHRDLLNSLPVAHNDWGY